jgi:hypothetical protein
LPVFKLIELPFCKTILIGKWNAPAHRYFLAYRAQGNFRQVLGLPVVDEFATFSSPIFFTSESMLGKIYNAGISLGHMRDPEMGIDLGWPPLCIGTKDRSAELPENWESALLNRIKEEQAIISENEENLVDGYKFQKVQIAGIDVYATDAPLLPKQLKRICQLSANPFSIAFSIGNKLTPQKNATPLSVKAISESSLNALLQAFGKG